MCAPEQLPQRDPGTPGSAIRLESGQPTLDRAQFPAVALGQALQRLSAIVQRADIPVLQRLSGLVDLDPAQRQPLGPADVGTIRVDPATPLPVEEGAAPLGVSFALRQQRGVGPPDPLGLDLEDGDSVDAAIVATLSALESLPMAADQGSRFTVDLVVEKSDRRGVTHARMVPVLLTFPAMNAEYLPCVELAPPEQVGASVIWLHGLGADGHDFEPIVPYLEVDAALAVRFVFPHAPRRAVTINAGLLMPAWYDIKEISLKREIDVAGVQESAGQLSALIGREVERGVPEERIVLAGFSQGGAIALHVALRHPRRLAGLVALSTYLVCDEQLEQERSEANRDLPVFQAHGSGDPMVPLAAGESARDRLTELGYQVDWKTYPMGHEVHPLEIREIGAQLNRMLV